MITKITKILRALANLLAAVLLIVSELLLVLTLFLSGIVNVYDLPDTFGISGTWLTGVFSSIYGFILVGILFSISILLIILVNYQHARYCFLTFSISSVIGGIACGGLSLVTGVMQDMVPGGWQNLIVNTYGVLTEFSQACMTVLVLIGIVSLSVCVSIKIIRGGAKHEEVA